MDAVWNIKSTDDSCIINEQLKHPLSITLKAGQANYTVVSNYGWKLFESNLEKPTEGEGQFKLKY